MKWKMNESLRYFSCSSVCFGWCQCLLDGNRAESASFRKRIAKFGSDLQFIRVILPAPEFSLTQRFNEPVNTSLIDVKWWPVGGDSFELKASRHEWPFKFTLPTQLPTSFEGEFGRVRYSVRVLVQRSWKLDLEYKQVFTVNSVVDLNFNDMAAVIWIFKWQQFDARIKRSFTDASARDREPESVLPVLCFETHRSPGLAGSFGLCSRSEHVLQRSSVQSERWIDVRLSSEIGSGNSVLPVIWAKFRKFKCCGQ